MKKLLLIIATIALSAAIGNALEVKKPKGGNLAETAEMKQMNASLKAVQNEAGPIVFVSGKAVLDVSKCKKTLDTIAGIVKKYPRFLVTVEGHTDNVGSASANKALSQKRAQAVVEWLIKNGGVDKKQLKAKGYGSDKPVADNKTEEGRAKNRRVDFEVSKL